MSGQLIISIGREFGSGGHDIARALAERFSLPLYEENMLNAIAERQGIQTERLSPYDETPTNRLIFRTVNGFNNAPSDALAHLQFQFLRDQAAEGRSFVVLGRCSEEVLKDCSGLISIFVLADIGFKVARILERGAASRDEALTLMAVRDRKRKYYHNQYCRGKWGDSRNYDLCVKSSQLGIPATVDLLETYIRSRINTPK